MGRARGESNMQATGVLARLSFKRVGESTMDRFADVLGTRRGSGREYPTLEQELEQTRDTHLQRLVEANGDVRYRNDKNELHRETGPAVELANGTRYWYQNDESHRLSLDLR